jgi:hypothetical protein
MKKIVMTAAVAVFAMTSAFAQYPAAGAHGTGSTSNSDVAPVNLSVSLTDMFDLAPTSGQTGTNVFGTDVNTAWAAWNDGQNFENVNWAGNTFYFLVSATRGFHLDISAPDMTDGNGNSIPAEHIEYSFASNDNSGNENSNWDNAKSKSGRVKNAATTLCTTNFGGWDMQFTVDFRLDDKKSNAANAADLYSLNLPTGVYSTVVTISGGLN